MITTRVKIMAVMAALTSSLCAGYAASDTTSHALASPESFAHITDTEKRSAAIFTELGKVLTHPRCTNCHPAGDSPRQGDTPRIHQPPVTRGADGHGLEAMRCHTCHQKANFEPGRIPGHPEWHLAPREMAWEGKTIAEICEQIRDPARNGGRKVEDADRPHRQGHPRRLGLEARLRPLARAGHTSAGWRAGRSVGEDGSGLSCAVMS